MRATIIGRGGARYKLTSTGHSKDLAVWCDCVMAERAYHWHLLSKHRTVKEAETAIDTIEAARRLVSP
jgi:hypothetical protein